jgi:hypothetical protein
MTRIRCISQDMKCQYIYDAIDHSNEIEKELRMLDEYFEK